MLDVLKHPLICHKVGFGRSSDGGWILISVLLITLLANTRYEVRVKLLMVQKQADPGSAC